MRKILKYLIYILFIPIWWLQKLVPRNKKIWVYGCWNGLKYGDNSKALYEYMLLNHKEINSVWITKNITIYNKLLKEEKECALAWSFKGVFTCLIAGKVIYSSGFSDVNHLFINGAKIIQAWHGAQMKKIGYDDKFGNSKFRNIIVSVFFPFMSEYKIHAFVSTSDIFDENLSKAFNIEKNAILKTGYPRNDVFQNQEEHNLISEWKVKFNSPTIVMYLPTFRSKDIVFSPFLDFNFDTKKWNSYLEKNNVLLISKGHSVDNKVGDNKNNARIIHLADNQLQDLNPLLKDIDVLITDYSSVYFDFLITEKPIIFTPFDLSNYLSNNRELYFEYEEIICGPMAKDWNDVLNSLEEILILDRYVEERKEKNRIFNNYNSKNNSEQLFKKILEI